MAATVLADAKAYLWRYGTMTDTTVDPVELLRDLVDEYEHHLDDEDLDDEPKPKARAKRKR